MDVFDLSAEKIIKNQEQLKSSRSDFDSLYQVLHNYFFVEGSNITDEKNKGAQLHSLLDSTSIDCADILAAGLCAYLTPESSKWLHLEHSDPKLRENDEVKRWMSDASDAHSCPFQLLQRNANFL